MSPNKSGCEAHPYSALHKRLETIRHFWWPIVNVLGWFCCHEQHCLPISKLQRPSIPWRQPSTQGHQLQHVQHSCLCATSDGYDRLGTAIQHKLCLVLHFSSFTTSRHFVDWFVCEWCLYDSKFNLELKNERNAHSLYSFSFLYNHIRKFFHVYEGAWPNKGKNGFINCALFTFLNQFYFIRWK